MILPVPLIYPTKKMKMKIGILLVLMLIAVSGATEAQDPELQARPIR
jgi:hypothetical protein